MGCHATRASARPEPVKSLHTYIPNTECVCLCVLHCPSQSVPAPTHACPEDWVCMCIDESLAPALPSPGNIPHQLIAGLCDVSFSSVEKLFLISLGLLKHSNSHPRMEPCWSPVSFTTHVWATYMLLRIDVTCNCLWCLSEQQRTLSMWWKVSIGY